MNSHWTGIVGVSAVLAHDGHVRGWLAKTQIFRGSILFAYFSTKKYGEYALPMAIFTRDLQLSLKAPLSSPIAQRYRRSASRTRSRTRSDHSQKVVGVQFVAGPVNGSGFWIATTGARGELTARKAFSIETYGFRQARQLAVAERASQVLAKKVRKASGTNEE